MGNVIGWTAFLGFVICLVGSCGLVRRYSAPEPAEGVVEDEETVFDPLAASEAAQRLGMRAVQIPNGLMLPCWIGAINTCYESANARHLIIVLRNEGGVWWLDRKVGKDGVWMHCPTFAKAVTKAGVRETHSAE